MRLTNSGVPLVVGVGVIWDGVAHNDELEIDARSTERSATLLNYSG